ncbi:VOC family protein [Hymenobacter cellulosivorans]|uniref:VOC family protein n=1 Tax=Hymenobacter cellulosivorans TaxID=2932249 RepID=A0ABY4FG17_9BACT|nr:VOC family protein [Hymenobacter cellulosivorans]UOQ54902.1 VOC family protein [Hymenobacter cellulosivorans]
MQKITTFLTFNDQAEEAAKLYTSIFPDSAIRRITRYPQGTYMPVGSVMTVEFELAGQKYVALNGGPHFTFTTGISLSVSCQDQAEIDAVWNQLTAAGGEPGDCGWLKDRFGVSWQVTPANMAQLISSPDPARMQRKMAAMMQMSKIDIATLENA